jgi:protein-disulfide isomerase
MPDDTDYDDLSGRTVDEVKEYVTNNDSVDIERLLRHEKRNKDRTTLTSWLEDRLDEQAASDTADAPSGITIQVSKRQAFIATFVIGFFAGGFIMAGAFSAAGATGLVGATGDPAEAADPSDGDAANTDDGGDTGDTNTGSGDSNRVMLSEDMLEGEPTLGSSDAPVTIVEYSDYGCPWCAEWAGFDAIPQRPIDQENTLDKIKSNFVDSGDARFIFKDYPVPRLHPNAEQAHVAANCIYEQGSDMYWEFHDLLFDERDRWTAGGGNAPAETFPDLAEQVGADVDAFNQCVENTDGSEIQQDKDGIHQVDARLGTPSIYIGNVEDGFRKVEGAQPFSALETLIQSEISQSS